MSDPPPRSISLTVSSSNVPNSPLPNAGSPPPGSLTQSYRVKGLCCAEEVNALRGELGKLTDIHDLSFDVLNAKMLVVCRPTLATSEITAAVARVGLSAEPWSDSPASAEIGKSQNAFLPFTIASGTLMLVGVTVHASASGWSAALDLGDVGTAAPMVSRGFYIASMVFGGWYVFPKAWAAVRTFRADMNLLMTVAMCGAMFIGKNLEAATVAFLFSLSLTLESWSVGRARRAVAALMRLTPTKARVICPTENVEELVDPTSVAVGTTVIVKPGERFPLDGKISQGTTSVDQSPITGESIPISKGVGDEVFAGSINIDGAIVYTSSKAAQDTTIARMIRMVADAQARRSANEQWVEKFARYYTPTVMVLAIAVMVLPPMLMGDWMRWLYQGLVLLVIACPCALVISTPVSIVAALSSAARNGVLVKGGRYLEEAAHLRAIAFDKTGTLTKGKPTVVEVVPLNGHTPAVVAAMAAAIESRSEHPLARAILAYAKEQRISLRTVDNYKAVAGKGATATLDGVQVWVGSDRFVHEQGWISKEVMAQIDDLSSRGLTSIVVGQEKAAVGIITLADQVRPEAKEALQHLKLLGVEHLIMLTGDNKQTAQAIAAQTSIGEFRAQLLPQDKVASITEIVAAYTRVGMVGDGVNDAPALARSSLGIAMGAAGSDAAIEVADVALMSEDLRKLPWLIEHSRRTIAIIRQNIVASLIVKAAFVALTIAGHASLWAAIAADTGMSLVVVFNALRLLKVSPLEKLPARDAIDLATRR